MIELTLEGLVRAFQSDWAKESKYVGILVDISGVKEVIINSHDNFEAKLGFYKDAYDEKLNHRYAVKINGASGVKIVGYTFGNCFAEIEEDLLGGSLDEI